MKTLLALIVALFALAACDDTSGFTTEADISEANINTECPVDVSEADRANFPACL
jgi:hypothetical protein